MPLRVAAGTWLIATLVGVAQAQDPTVQRIASMVAIAVGEYGNGIDARGHMIAPSEYKETVDFLAEARAAAGRPTAATRRRYPRVVDH